MSAATTRRQFLTVLPAATIAATTPARAAAGVSRELHALIEAHKAAYAALIDRASLGKRAYAAADRIEQEALLAICSYPAINLPDRRAKARYLLDVEARGELDLEQHMQALLHSMLTMA